MHITLAAKRIVKAALGRAGYRIVPLTGWQMDPMPALLTSLKQLGFRPAHIVDVGANRGYWTRDAVKFFPDAQFTMIEPQDFLRVYSDDVLDGRHKVRWINAGVSDRPGKMHLTLFPRDDGSSFRLTAEEAAARGLKQVEIDVITLNDLAKDRSLPFPDMVKIDAEGFDLKVLGGASDLLGRTDVFMIESAVAARDMENTLLKVVSLMDQCGYAPFDIPELIRSPRHGVVWLCEIVYLRKGSPLFEAARHY